MDTSNSGEPDQGALRLGILWWDPAEAAWTVEPDWHPPARRAVWDNGCAADFPASADWQLTTEN
jgi:hypothetical protein